MSRSDTREKCRSAQADGKRKKWMQMRKPFISILLIFFLSVLFLCGPLQRKTSTVTAFRAAVDESGAESATAQYR